MFCPKCGKEIKNESKYCSHCGNLIKSNTTYCGQQSVKQNSLEKIIGKNILAIVAAILIFVGIIAFGAIVLKEIGNLGKLTILYLMGIILAILGFVLSLKNKSMINSSILGCGIGTVYIATFLGGIYYKLIDVFCMNVIIFGISMCVFIIINKLELKYLTIISSIGSLLAIIFSLTQSLLEFDFLELVIFETLTISLFILSGYKEKWFKYAVQISMFLNFILMLVFNNFYDFSFCGECFNLNSVFKILSVLILLCSSVALIILLGKKNENRVHFLVSSIILSNVFSIGLNGPFVTFYQHFMNSSIYESHSLMSEYNLSDVSRNLPYLLSFVTISLLFIIFMVIYNNGFKIKKNAELLIVPFMVLHSCALTEIVESFNICFLLAMPAFLLLLLFMFTEKMLYWYSSFGFLIFATIIEPTLLTEADFINTICYATLLLVCAEMLSYTKNKRFLSYPALSFSIILYNTVIIYPYIKMLYVGTDEMVVSLIISAFVGILYLSSLYKYPTNNIQKIVIGVVKNFFVIFGMLTLGFATNEIHTVNQLPHLITGSSTEIILAVLLFLLAMIRLREVIKEKSNVYGLMYAIKFSLIVFWSLSCLTTLTDNNFISSFICLILSALCILFGFKSKIKSVRIYGLITILISVLKLVIVDFWLEDSLIRVAVFILGGLICFGISAGYTYIEKKTTLVLNDGNSVQICSSSGSEKSNSD